MLRVLVGIAALMAGLIVLGLLPLAGAEAGSSAGNATPSKPWGWASNHAMRLATRAVCVGASPATIDDRRNRPPRHRHQLGTGARIAGARG